MRKGFLLTFLSAFLYLALALLFIVLIGVPITAIPMLTSDFSFSMLMNVIFSIIYIFNYFMIVRKLLDILNSTETTPFIFDNVKRFKLMGYCLSINSIFECFMGYSGSQDVGNIQILATKNGAITPVMIICVISALMCFVIAEIFDKAIQIKEDNDLTI